MTLKLLQDRRVFNVNVFLFTFLDAYSVDSNCDSQHWHRKFWHFLTPFSFRFSHQFFKVRWLSLTVYKFDVSKS